jgi:hypothetical protein
MTLETQYLENPVVYTFQDWNLLKKLFQIQL